MKNLVLVVCIFSTSVVFAKIPSLPGDALTIQEDGKIKVNESKNVKIQTTGTEQVHEYRSGDTKQIVTRNLAGGQHNTFDVSGSKTKFMGRIINHIDGSRISAATLCEFEEGTQINYCKTISAEICYSFGQLKYNKADLNEKIQACSKLGDTLNDLQNGYYRNLNDNQELISQNESKLFERMQEEFPAREKLQRTSFEKPAHITFQTSYDIVSKLDRIEHACRQWGWSLDVKPRSEKPTQIKTESNRQ